MKRLIILLQSFLLVCLISCGGSDSSSTLRSKLEQSSTAEAAVEAPPAELSEMEKAILKKFTGDLDDMVKRGAVRILVPYSMTYFFHDGAVERGPIAEAGRLLQQELQKKFANRTKHIDVVFVPTPRDQLFDALIEGRGDIAAGGITVTEQRAAMVDFSEPTTKNVAEIIVASKSAPKLNGLADLSGQKVFVRPSSSHFESLRKLNMDLRAAGKEPAEIVELDDSLESSDLLEMVNADLIPITIADNHVAEMWSGALPEIQVYSKLQLNAGQNLAWALRKNSPQLKEFLDAFITKNKVGTTFGNIMVKRYFTNNKWITNPNASAERKRFEDTVALFKKYGEKYDFDYLLLAAQGFQESKLDQSLRSRVGAIGVMQLMPKTGESMQVGDVSNIEPNIHAGSKYLRNIADQYFADEQINSLNRTLFSFAAYNAGPTRISRIRQQAKDAGLDPNVWFGNVEQLVAKKVSSEPVTYVRNIYKYYVAYKLAQNNIAIREKAKDSAA